LVASHKVFRENAQGFLPGCLGVETEDILDHAKEGQLVVAAGPAPHVAVSLLEGVEDLPDRRGGPPSRDALDRFPLENLPEEFLGLGLGEGQVGMAGREDATLPLMLDPERVGGSLASLEQQISSSAKPES
jgi:hypothetical protein